MSEHVTDAQSRTDGLSRRSVIRAGAHAAWAVPVISVATAPPAAATLIVPDKPKQPAALTLSMTDITKIPTPPAKSAKFTLTISNGGELDSKSPDAVNLEVVNGKNRWTKLASASTTSPGWTVTSDKQKFYASYALGVPAGSSVSAEIIIASQDSGTDGSGKVTAILAPNTDADVESTTPVEKNLPA